MLTAGITPKNDSLLLFPLKLAQFSFADVVGVIDLRMGEKI